MLAIIDDNYDDDDYDDNDNDDDDDDDDDFRRVIYPCHST